MELLNSGTTDQTLSVDANVIRVGRARRAIDDSLIEHIIGATFRVQTEQLALLGPNCKRTECSAQWALYAITPPTYLCCDMAAT